MCLPRSWVLVKARLMSSSLGATPGLPCTISHPHSLTGSPQIHGTSAGSTSPQGTPCSVPVAAHPDKGPNHILGERKLAVSWAQTRGKGRGEVAELQTFSARLGCRPAHCESKKEQTHLRQEWRAGESDWPTLLGLPQSWKGSHPWGFLANTVLSQYKTLAYLPGMYRTVGRGLGGDKPRGPRAEHSSKGA